MESTAPKTKTRRRRRMNQNRKNAYICIGIFAFFVLLLITALVLVLTSVIPTPKIPAPLLGLIGFIFFFPAIAALFFMGRYYNDKKKYKLGDILTIVSAVYLIFALIQTILVLTQVVY